MEVDKRIQAFLETLDSWQEPISEYNISTKIREHITENYRDQIPEVILWEQVAFDFVENYPRRDSRWETYFGPLFILPNEEGQMVEYPSVQKITEDIINYWKKRAKESNNPILKARYANLVWEFSKKVTGKKPHYSIAQIFIDSVIEIVEKKLYKYEVDVIEKLERALTLALSISDEERLDKLIDIIISYEESIAEDDKPGLWGFSYELLLKNKNNKVRKKLGEGKKRAIIKKLEERYERLIKGGKHWAAQRAALLLAEYYLKTDNKDKAKEVILKLGELIKEQSQKVSPLIAITWLDQVCKLYKQYGLKDEANDIAKHIKNLGKHLPSEFKKIEASIKIPKQKIDNFINEIIDGYVEDALTKIVIKFLPLKKQAEDLLKDLSEKAPLQFLFIRKIVDGEGRPIASIGPLEDDLEGNIVNQISQIIYFDSFLLGESLSALKRKFNLETGHIINFLYKSPVFDEDKKEFLIRGIDAYLRGDFLTSLHILIPQIEAAIRKLAEILGAPVLKPSRTGGYFYKTLDELLREEAIVQTLTEDLCLYLRVLLTDPRGWNLRNDICHGISKPEQLNQMSADKVFHTILCLGLIREKT